MRPKFPYGASALSLCGTGPPAVQFQWQHPHVSLRKGPLRTMCDHSLTQPGPSLHCCMPVGLSPFQYACKGSSLSPKRKLCLSHLAMALFGPFRRSSTMASPLGMQLNLSAQTIISQISDILIELLGNRVQSHPCHPRYKYNEPQMCVGRFYGVGEPI